jgi:HEPN/Toprim N-terminal domain 1
MGTYTEFYIADYPVFSSKSYVSSEVMTLFRESDKKVYQRKLKARNEVTWGQTYAEDEEIETAIEYRALVKHVQMRMNIMGFTINRVRKEFEESKADKLNELKTYAEEDYPTEGLWDDEIKVLENNGFQDFLAAYKKILESGVGTFKYLDKFPKSSDLIKYILRNDEILLGFPCIDYRCVFRVLLEIAPDDSFAVQDITDVVYSGYYDEKDPVCNLALKELKGDYPANSKIIILTEGTTDTEVLEPSLKLLYPHLCEYYSFMDFGVKPPGGVGPLMNAVKSFAGAGIENRIIALFDNDTAAFSAVESLKDIDIPSNILVTHYPDTDLGKNFPAQGPTGLVHQNVNGLAGSIELYFGADVLNKNGELTPIQWKGFDERIGKYQGEILHKDELKKKFLTKLKICQKDPSRITQEDWSEIDQIFKHIFNLFNS